MISSKNLKMKNSKVEWRQVALNANATLKDAIKNLDASALKIVIVIDKDGKLEGTVSDGDVRRGLLRGLGLENTIAEVMSRSPLVAPENIGHEIVLGLMSANKVQQIPVVDGDNRVVDLYLWNEIGSSSSIKNKFFIMAGGRGQRLMPHTQDIPKPMMVVNGKPMLQHIIEKAYADGFREFVISLHYLGDIIESYFGNGDKFNIQIQYVKENSPMGTAGAIGLLNEIPEEPFIVTNCDVLADIKYSEVLNFHLEQNADATMAVHQHVWQNPFGVVEVQGQRLIGITEKPIIKSYVNAGIYVLSANIAAMIESGIPINMPELFQKANESGLKSVVYPMHESWMDIGNPEDLFLANNSNSEGV